MNARDSCCNFFARLGLSASLVLACLQPGAAVASPTVPLRDTTLGTQSSQGRGCALVGNQLQCWGDYVTGQPAVGNAAVESLTTWVRRPDTATGDFDHPSSLAVLDRTCLTDAAGVWCWGNNDHGQLGLGDRVDRAQPERLRGLPNDVIEVAFGSYHACARTLASGVWCWGGNSYGETGNPPIGPQTGALAVPSLPGTVSALTLGGNFSCALSDRVVRCWGNNQYGQLGDGTTTTRSLPAPVTGLPADIRKLAAGERHACAIDGKGDLWCWGDNERGQVGVAITGTPPFEPRPRRVETLGGPAAAMHLGGTQKLRSGRRHQEVLGHRRRRHATGAGAAEYRATAGGSA